MKTQEECRAAGERARERGNPMHTNPFTPARTRDQWEWWREGWRSSDDLQSRTAVHLK